MGKNVLVVYASRAGSTGEVAQRIGEVLCEKGASVTVRRVQDIRSLDGYDAVVFGTPYRMGKPIPEAVRFLSKHRAALKKVPVAFFTLGVTMNTDTPEHRQTAETYAEPMKAVIQPVSLGLFGGKVDPSKLEPMWRFMLQWVKEGDMGPGDHRDFAAIQAWAETLPETLHLA